MALQRFTLTIEGPNLHDVYDVELLQLPEVGQPIETRLGSCVVTHAERSPDGSQYAGKIVCRLS